MPFLPNVPRCQHLKVNGTQCGSPALKRNRFCFFHKRFQEEQIKLNCDRARRSRPTFILPVLEDANSIQVSLMQIMRLLARGQIDAKIASLLLYALQTATLNLRHVTFEPSRVMSVVIDRNTIDQTCIGGDQWCEEDFEDEEEEDEEHDEKPVSAAQARLSAWAQARVAKAEAERTSRLPGFEVAGEDGPFPKKPALQAAQTTPTTPAPTIKAPENTSSLAPSSVHVGTAAQACPEPSRRGCPAERSSAILAADVYQASVASTPATAAPPSTADHKKTLPPKPPAPAKPNKKKPSKNVDVAEARKQIQKIARDWIMQTVEEPADAKNAGS